MVKNRKQRTVKCAPVQTTSGADWEVAVAADCVGAAYWRDWSASSSAWLGAAAAQDSAPWNCLSPGLGAGFACVVVCRIEELLLTDQLIQNSEQLKYGIRDIMTGHDLINR